MNTLNTRNVAAAARWRLLVLAFAALCLVPISARGPLSARPVLEAGAAAEKPTILLTGFEPFGKGKPPNPSWEAIKELDGTVWNGHVLVCKQMRCVWDSPRAQLEKWIADHRPVAVFSFGSGRRDAFDLEIRAANQRADAKDNEGVKPAVSVIKADGPDRFLSAGGRERLARWLADKGYPTRVSTDAGRYLCNEALYTLEDLRSSGAVRGPVSFTHVPPLDAEVAGKKVTAAYVRSFVMDMLEGWHTLAEGEKETKATDKAAGKDDDRETKAIKAFVTRYFKTWSDQDMKAYESLFLPDACVQYVDSSNRVSTQLRPEFIQSQRDYHRTAAHKATEVAEHVDIRMEEKLARVVVYWKLTAGPRVEYGYDHFSLLKVADNWRIVNLVFYGVPRKK